MDELKEVWFCIKDFPNYKVSNLGSVKSLNYRNKRIEKKLAKRKNQDGYIMAMLRHNGVSKNKRVHRLVAEAFIPNHNNKPYINHINGVKSGNRIENLEWCTSSENNKHAFINGLNYINIESVKERFSKKVINNITGEIFDSITLAAISININKSTMYSQLSGKNPNKINFKYF